jgi:diguanylate cyclase (GGDEF)-like protein
MCEGKEMERVLIVDDSPVFCKVLRATLEAAGYAVLTVANGSQAIEILKMDDSPDLVLLDRVMPDMDGVEVCKWARQHICRENGSRYKYFIILTSKNSQDDVLEGFALGADDYVMKPFCTQELLARMAVGSRVLKLQRELWNAAVRDALTGLYNRRFLYDLLASELARAQRKEGSVAVAMLDVDHFKQVNDMYGHVVGDEALVIISQRLRSVLREFDLIGRLGGEEFVLAFSCDTESEARGICERVRTGIAEQPILCDGAELNLTISIGFAVVQGGIEPSAAIRYADKALYQAKRSGRNCVAVYNLNQDR